MYFENFTKALYHGHFGQDGHFDYSDNGGQDYSDNGGDYKNFDEPLLIEDY